ncbi:MAG: DUF3488 and transglutaminase-like domain-containing protein [Burkholderiaceae bacterium]|jgi:transglutaminase-like putative cysteine protease|nr:DUF3488 and transglutaminase-like domain-containing protein [Burkholderiaceae bacterium]
MNLARLPRDTRDTLFLLAVIGWIVLPLVTWVPVWTSVLTAGLLLWRGWLALKGRPLPSRWGLVLLLPFIGAGTLLSHGALVWREAGMAVRDAGVTIIMCLLALKTLELRARRDAFVVFFLGFFTVLANFFYSQTLPVAAAMLLGLLGLLTGLIHAHRPAGQPALRESALLALKMALLGAPLTAALFMLFPRFAPLWGIPSDGLTGRTGLSSSMEVGNMATLALDGSIAFRVKFDGDRIPPQSQLYFRGPVLTRFDGRQWRMTEEFETRGAAERRAALRVAGQPVGYTVTLEPSNRPWLMVMDAAAAPPELPERSGPGSPEIRRPRMTSALQWLAPIPVTDVLRYHAESYPDFSYGLPESRPFDPRPYLALPAGYDPRTRELAGQMRQQVGENNPGALVDAALARLRTDGYAYTLEPGVYGRDTADEFWFDRKEGFCEHIASSFVILMRAADVPARIVTGYQGGEINSVDGYWTVRQSDAHAWAEVWLPERGWVRVDPTGSVAPGRIGQFARLQAPEGIVASAIATLSPTMLAQLRAVWEAVNNGWNQWVLNYTQSRQFDLLRNLGLKDPNWRDLVKLMGALLVLSALAGIVWAWWERGQHDPWLRLLSRARRKLAQAGITAPPNAPPRQLANQTAASPLPAELRQSLHDWLLALERLRYAPGGKAGAKSLATLARELRRLRWGKSFER